MTGGGLAPSGQAWLPLSRRYLFPVKVMGALFRGKFLDGLRHLHRSGLLALTGRAAKLAAPAAFDRLLDQLYRISWVVYAKRPFAGPERVFRYLGRYTHRVAISNHRIQIIDEHGVRFATKDGRSITLPHQAFIARFLEHVLPSGYTKIRHFGLHAPGNLNTKWAQARLLVSSDPVPPPPACTPENPCHGTNWSSSSPASTQRCAPAVAPVSAATHCRRFGRAHHRTRRDSSPAARPPSCTTPTTLASGDSSVRALP